MSMAKRLNRERGKIRRQPKVSCMVCLALLNHRVCACGKKHGEPDEEHPCLCKRCALKYKGLCSSCKTDFPFVCESCFLAYPSVWAEFYFISELREKGGKRKYSLIFKGPRGETQPPKAARQFITSCLPMPSKP